MQAYAPEQRQEPGESEPRAWHALHAVQAAQAIQSDAALGLSPEDAHNRLRRFGDNALPEPKQRSLLSVFLSQFQSPLIYLLLAAAGVALALNHHSDAIVIAVVVVLNALIGAYQEGRAERALAALRKLAVHNARVIRGGSELLVPARALVPGDVLLVEAGDAVSADARLIEGAALQIAEAALTGESVPVSKKLAALALDTPLADRNNMIYAGTHVTAGRARAVVVATGLHTEIGHIAALAESAHEGQTPLERRVSVFGRYIMVAAAAVFSAVVLIGSWRGVPMGEILMVGISQVVGLIPEGLPVAMTIALAVGVQRMANRNAVVRRLSAVETLGSTTVICSDKTGTLTKNEMTATALYLPSGRKIAVSGSGYEPVGTFSEQTLGSAGVTEQPIDAASDPALRELLEACVLCSDATLVSSSDLTGGPKLAKLGDTTLEQPNDTAQHKAVTWQPLGDPTEVALVALAMKAGLAPGELRAQTPRSDEIPFDATTKLMFTQHEVNGRSRVIIKGAPEAVLPLCRAQRDGDSDIRMSDEQQRGVADAVEHMGEAALRVLAVAVADDAQIDVNTGAAAFKERATLLGLVGQIDPPRPEAKVAVERCQAAGIRPVMVTGDHKATGYAIAKALGIAHEGDIAIDGRELQSLSNAELKARASKISVFARVEPAQKLRIIQAFQQTGEVVAMTGDGVNDAPALVKADVGVAMGRSGTEVAKEAAKIVISDDNFATIVAAVEEGRVAYQNIKKAVLLLFSTSLAEVLVLLIAMLLGYPPPFAAVQILWNNLVTEGVTTVNLVMEPAEGYEMTREPITRDEPLLTRELLERMALMVPAIVIATLGWFTVRTSQGIAPAQVQTETFTLLAVCEWFNVLNCRSPQHSAFRLDLLKNKWLLGGLLLGNLLQFAVVYFRPLGNVFHTVPIGGRELLALGVVGSLVLWVEELRKLVERSRSKDADA